MKKIMISLAFALLGIANLYGAKAYSGIAQVTLADGTQVAAKLYGDEHFHYYMTLDGTPLSQNADGKFVKSTQEALHARREQAMKARQAKEKAKWTDGATRATSIGHTWPPSYFPHSGSPRALVILVEFQDVKFKSPDPVATFNHYLNSSFEDEAPEADAKAYSTKKAHTNYGSVRQYFNDMSLGQFTPQFDIVGPVTVSQKSAYYGKDQGNDIDINDAQMISEACTLVADKVDFSQYDANNDGNVDLVYIIYAGFSQSFSGNSDDFLWPKSGSYDFYQYDQAGNKVLPAKKLSFNGKTICRFGINNELNSTESKSKENGYFQLCGIGLFCHEFSHTLGLPDHYETDGRAYDNQTPDYWDLMDAGEYTAHGYCPTPYHPWEQMIMGWITPFQLNRSTPLQLALEPYDAHFKTYKIDADVNKSNFFMNENYTVMDPSEFTYYELMERAKGEFLLLQNIRKKGWWKDLPGSGMLVWRIDYGDLEDVNIFDYPNNEVGIPRVMIVPADGLAINMSNVGSGRPYTSTQYWESCKNDPFPAIGEDGAEVNSLTEVKFNWSTMTTSPLYNIQKDKNSDFVSFDFLKDFAAAAGINDPISETTDKRPTEYFDLEGRKVANPQRGHLYITNKNKKVIY